MTDSPACVAMLAQGPVRLTHGEVAALACAANGHTIRQTAMSLKISESSVKSHLRRACRKLGALNRTHAVALAFRAGVLT